MAAAPVEEAPAPLPVGLPPEYGASVAELPVEEGRRVVEVVTVPLRDMVELLLPPTAPVGLPA
jgi:hypothetical protein